MRMKDRIKEKYKIPFESNAMRLCYDLVMTGLIIFLVWGIIVEVFLFPPEVESNSTVTVEMMNAAIEAAISDTSPLGDAREMLDRYYLRRDGSNTITGKIVGDNGLSIDGAADATSELKASIYYYIPQNVPSTDEALDLLDTSGKVGYFIIQE